jgi:hypothetical protein
VSADWDPGHRGRIEPEADEEPELDEGRPGRRRPDRSGPDGDGRDAPDAGRIAWLVAGALAIAAGTALGWDSAALSALVTPPPLIRAAFVGISVGVGLVLLLGALNRLAGDDDDGFRASRGETRRDIGTMIRGVRLVFLAVAALAAASGWILGHPLPLVVALVIAGVDVLETSFLLIVVGLRPPR